MTIITTAKHWICTVILLLIGCICHAQDKVTKISGKVIDENNAFVEYATVAVYSEDKVVTGTTTDLKGYFEVKVPRTSEAYKISITFIGYLKTELMLKADRYEIKLGDIRLKNDVKLLDDVVVTAKIESQKSSIERTSINADANIGASRGTAADILSSSSAVSISNDAVSIRGNSNVLILIDGVPTTMSDLSAIPAANIKNIEILTNPDASYDSEGTGGIINIISKKEKAAGLSGVASANYGFNHFVAANTALSYNKGKSSYRFNYNTRYEDDIIDGTLNRKFKSSNKETYQEMLSNRYVFNTNIGLGAEFRLNAKNTLDVGLNLTLPRLNVKQDLHNTHTVNDIANEEYRHNDVTWNRENIEAVVSYKHIIKPEISDISFRGSISKIWGHRPSYYYLNDNPVNYSNSGGSPFISAIQSDFKKKINKSVLTAGAKFTYRTNTQHQDFYSYNEGEWVYSNKFSSDFVHSEMVPAAYVMYSSKINKKFSYKAGLRGEYSHVTLNSIHENINESRDDFFVAPSISASYVISEYQDLSFALSRRIGRPTYPQLNPFTSMVDATTYEQGNIRLNPEKSTKIDLAYNLKGELAQLFVDAYFNYTKDYITQITTIEDELLITTYINAPYDVRAGADISIKVKPVKWMNLTLNTNTYNVNIKGNQNGVDVSNGGIVNNSNVLLDFMPSKKTDIQVQYFLSTPQYFAQLTTTFNHYINIAVKHKFCKGKLVATASLTDVFNTKEWTVYTDNEVFEMINHSTNKSRMLWIGLSYNFNSFKQKKQEKKGEIDRSLINFGL